MKGRDRAMARGQREQKTLVVPAPAPSLLLAQAGRVAARGQPCHGDDGLGLSSPISGNEGRAGGPCPASAGHKDPMSPWQCPSCVLPILLSQCPHAPRGLDKEQGRAVSDPLGAAARHDSIKPLLRLKGKILGVVRKAAAQISWEAAMPGSLLTSPINFAPLQPCILGDSPAPGQ